jgi:glycosyltransferase involved in cell wall biosynthesis
MKLSICIATLPTRKQFFDELTNHLAEQILAQDAIDEVEIVSECDNGEMSIGNKRQKMLEDATGDYVVNIDDDDRVPDFYVEKILEAIKENPDCIGFRVECHNIREGVTASVSNKYKDWLSNHDGFDFVRCIHHLTPVKREISLKIGYKDMKGAEDSDYSFRLRDSGLLKKEVYINEVMYYYLYNRANDK